MDEIKVVPYIPDEDYDNPAMVVDFYEFTMQTACFCTDSRTPRWCLTCSSARTRTIRLFHQRRSAQADPLSAELPFNAQDIWWLRTKGMSEEFCEYLRTYRWKGDMYALPEGTVCYPPRADGAH